MLARKVLGNLSQRANSYRHLPLKDQAQIACFFLFIFFLPFNTRWFLTTYPGIFHIFMAGYFGPSPSLLSRWENNPSSFLLYSCYKETHNSAFMYSKVLMRFNGIVSSLYVYTGNPWQGCEFICWGTFTVPPHKIKTECFTLFWQKSDAYFSKKWINSIRNIISFRTLATFNVHVICCIF